MERKIILVMVIFSIILILLMIVYSIFQLESKNKYIEKNYEVKPYSDSQINYPVITPSRNYIHEEGPIGGPRYSCVR